jgi:hypothetical protein
MTKFLQDKRFVWVLFLLVALCILIIYLVTSIHAGQGNLLMPLDDVYIHFQYARQMATGHAYQYNNIDSPTSGATSFIYPYILASGYLIGFQGLWLGLWAMLIGTMALIAAMWAIYRLCKTFELPQYLALLTTVSFALTGSITWHFMSGMETGLMMALTLWVLLLVLEKRFRSFIVFATLLSLTRPEGGVLVFIASGTMFLRLWPDFGAQEKRGSKRIQLLLLAIPILAIGVQPLVNLLITGTSVATGNQAKSILATVPHDWRVIISRIWDNFLRMGWEFITGYDGLEGRGWYLPLFTGLLGLLAIPILFFKKNYRLIALMLLAWLLIMSAAISTLDTAFWHFKRYQMPMMALFFPLAGWVVSLLINRVGARRALPLYKIRYFLYVYPFVILPIFSIVLFFQFLHYHALNVSYVYQQPYQMALWLRENTPENAIVAVHDVGLMRYIGERSTLDIVGLTTPDAAAYWRNGPGSVAQFLINHQPDYIANYGRGHGYGLAYLADTSLYENELAAFPIDDWQPYLNVALAADFQGIYQPDWDIGYLNRRRILNNLYGNTDTYFSGTRYLDVANLRDEAFNNYSWGSQNYSGFTTEVYDFDSTFDGLRRINQFEEFTIYTQYLLTDEQEPPPAVLVTRVHSQFAGTIDIYIDNVFLDTQWIPNNPGHWMNIATYIPPELQGKKSRIRIEANIPQGYYLPAFHQIQLFQPYDPSCCMPDSALGNYQNGAIQLIESVNLLSENNLDIVFKWYSDGNAQGDYRLFVHLYDDINQPPLVQWDGYFTDMPVGNWLPGNLSDTITLNVENIPDGTYKLAIGFYNPQNPQDRLVPESDVYEISPDGRLWLGEITIDDR